jgi:hypothetical protein
MSWIPMFVLFYAFAFTGLMAFVAAAAQLNERADRWAEEMSDYFTWREMQRAS